LSAAQKNCNLKLNYRRHDIQNNDTLYNDTLPTGDSMTILIKTTHNDFTNKIINATLQTSFLTVICKVILK
jgi:hypothetical protein